MRKAPIVISEWNVISPFGIGKQEFAEGTSMKDPYQDQFYLDSIDLSLYMNKKGTRLYDRSTKLAVLTSYFIIEELKAKYSQDSTGVVLGTNYGSFSDSCEFMSEVLRNEELHKVDPSRFPNTVMNAAASQIAIKFGLKGINCTVSGGGLNSLNAINFSINALKNGYIDSMLVGSVEEYSELLFKTYEKNNEGKRRLSEGCAIFFVESEINSFLYGRKPVAEIIFCNTGMFYGDDLYNSAKISLVKKLETMASSFSIHKSEILAFPSQNESSELLHAEIDAVQEVFGNTVSFNFQHNLGNCFGTLGSIQIATYLSNILNNNNSLEYGLFTFIDYNGMIGCLLLRRRG